MADGANASAVEFIRERLIAVEASRAAVTMWEQFTVG